MKHISKRKVQFSHITDFEQAPYTGPYTDPMSQSFFEQQDEAAAKQTAIREKNPVKDPDLARMRKKNKKWQLV